MCHNNSPYQVEIYPQMKRSASLYCIMHCIWYQANIRRKVGHSDLILCMVVDVSLEVSKTTNIFGLWPSLTFEEAILKYHVLTYNSGKVGHGQLFFICKYMSPIYVIPQVQTYLQIVQNVLARVFSVREFKGHILCLVNMRP